MPSISRKLRRRAGVSLQQAHCYHLVFDDVLGIVAAQRIPAKTFVGIYAGEFITDIEGETRGK